MRRLVLAAIAAAMVMVLLPAAPQSTGIGVKTYQVTVTGDADVVVTFGHSDSVQISLCNTGSTNACYVRFGPGAVVTTPDAAGNTDLVVQPGTCPPSLFVRTNRVAFHKGAGDTTVQMIVVYGLAR